MKNIHGIMASNGMKEPGAIACRGFTLLEILVSLAIMAMAVVLILQLFSTNLRALSRSANMTEAVVRGDAMMQKVLAEPMLTEKVWSETTDDGYRMDVAVAEVVKDRADGLPVRLMEVALTVYWIDGGREKSFKLKTMKLVAKPK
jgi:prepilin-type N-terminal cleavage/methylation domain-containing protein